MGQPVSAAQLRESPPPKIIERFFEFSLLGMLASGFFAVSATGYLDWSTAILALAGLMLRAAMVSGVTKIQVSGRLADSLAIVFVAFYPVDYLYLSGSFFPATVHLLFFLMVGKL